MVERVHQRQLTTMVLAASATRHTVTGLGPLRRLQSLLPIDDVLRNQQVLPIRFRLVLRE